MAFNILYPSKKLSQLIAKSWLDRQELSIDKQFLLDNGLISRIDAEYVQEIVMDKNPEGPLPYVGEITISEEGEGKLRIRIPYPNRPPELTDEELERWVNDDNPDNIKPTNIYIPYSTS
ncbi:MAG: hypothetical protein KME30_32390 [Iphinoe sp. HA4291-MV1]|jgi:hypothetical protein|nr:hypothetical protein [Iphinoe sp. HA4291-MV1]